MLVRDLKHKNSAVSKQLAKFAARLDVRQPSLSRANRLLFLCGANRSPGVPSPRRQAIKRFVESISSDYRVIYAEGVFNELAKVGHGKNALDLEHEISAIADRILIVLESPSAFCELGAFAHQTLREKLIIINDSQFRGNGSFIDTGPLAAATECKSPILWYPMGADGLSKTDGIGAIFSELKAAVDARPVSVGKPTSSDIADLSASKLSLYFIHDLVLFVGPVTHAELIDVLITTFGKKSFDMAKSLLGILREARLIVSNQVGTEWVFQATTTTPFLQYAADTNTLMATFRRYHLQTNPKRFADEHRGTHGERVVSPAIAA
ncbi:retron St85 family effector protein [Burkholderia cenocepacia]|uniref:retron St85 family effector protein n=1 Tax=Burkholderia cenocepacia TaxID=95486 RepID=UPI0011788CB4|nr:retron St85 family effector protein [Burkholderia cenocepacia]MCW3688788.1 retron St85 family effector protein [Burkholderia cenocepacia]